MIADEKLINLIRHFPRLNMLNSPSRNKSDGNRNNHVIGTAIKLRQERKFIAFECGTAWEGQGSIVSGLVYNNIDDVGTLSGSTPRLIIIRASTQISHVIPHLSIVSWKGAMRHQKFHVFLINQRKATTHLLVDQDGVARQVRTFGKKS